MASPQKEDGYTPIAHEILEALSRRVISPDEWRILMIIFRRTYGWDKKEDRISHSQFSRTTGIPRKHIPRVIKKLLARNIIYKGVPHSGDGVPQTGDRTISIYGFQKDFDKWVGVPHSGDCPLSRTEASPKQGTGVSPEQGHTKENNKTILTKEKLPMREEFFVPPIPPLPPIPPEQPKKEKANPDIKLFIDFWSQEYQKSFKAKYHFIKGKDGAIVKSLLADFPLAELKRMAGIFFQSDSAYVRTAGFTLSVFRSQTNKIISTGGIFTNPPPPKPKNLGRCIDGVNEYMDDGRKNSLYEIIKGTRDLEEERRKKSCEPTK